MNTWIKKLDRKYRIEREFVLRWNLMIKLASELLQNGNIDQTPEHALKGSNFG